MSIFSPRLIQRGFSLVELLFTLGIGVLILTAVWAAYGDRNVDVRSREHARAVLLVFSQADEAYATSIEFQTEDGAGVFTAASMDRLAAARGGELPQGIFAGPGGYENIWSGNWSVTVGSTNGGVTQDLLNVQSENIPRLECTRLLQLLAPQMYATRVNGTLVGLVPAATGTDVGRHDLNFEQGFPLCQDANTMTFTRLKELDLYSLRRLKPYSADLTDEEDGTTLSDAYQQAYLFHFNRLQDAYAARETAQLAIPAP